MFQSATYQSRRSLLTQQLQGRGIVLLMGNEESPINYAGNVYRFRQDSNFLYFIGLDQAHLAAVIDLDEGSTTLFGNDLSIEDVVWEGPQPTMKQLAALSGIEHTAPYTALEEALTKAKSAGRAIHFTPPYRAENKIRLGRWLGIATDDLKTAASEALIKAIVQQRAHKTEEEIAEMELALDITRDMHIAAMRQARPGIRESDLAGTVEGIAIARGGRPAYGTILSVNGQTLHNPYYTNMLEKGRVVLGDFGAETGRHYAGDITRAFPVDSQFTPRQKDIYNIVLEAEVKAIEACRPGIRYADVHLLAARIIVDGMKSIGLMKGNTDDAVAEGAHALFFPHGLGHMIGLDVHDMEDLGEQYVGYGDMQRSTQFGTKYLRLARALEPGFVFTVEPGIYFIPELFDLWHSQGKFSEFVHYEKLDEYRQFGGIRIEDNVLITDTGYRVLGPPIPKTVEEVEALRQV
ncbi:MAG: aminopeptidase P family protein [Saprospiraceae bacterium]|nr:aminopeptidase P family protein [Saprospiraceae bacterium]